MHHYISVCTLTWLQLHNYVVLCMVWYIDISLVCMSTTYHYITESVFAPLPRPKRGMALVMHGDPKGKNFLYTVGNSVIIRDIEVSVCRST